jgi:hypothetical protein
MLQVTNVHSKVITTILTSLLLVCNFGHSSVVAGTAVRIQGYPPPWGNNYEIRVDQTIEGDDYTVALFSADSANSAITLRAITLDEGSSWYLASYGQTFSQISLPNFSRISFNEPIQLYDSVFYLAINTGKSAFYPAAQEVFGWAKFGLSANNNLTLIDSAMDYGDRGIIVGTYQSVPEPSSLSLLLIGLAGVAFRRLLKRRS